MTRRRRNSAPLLELLMHKPWWVSVVCAVIAYALFGILPRFMLSDPMLAGMRSTALAIAPWAGLVFLLPIPFSIANRSRKRAQLDNQRDIRTIRELSWKQFEELVAESYRRQGFAVIENTRAGADGGVDVWLKRGIEIHAVQCKHWRSRQVGVGTVRELFGVMSATGAAGGAVVCTGRFTQQAYQFAAGKRIRLIDGDALAGIVREIQNGAGVGSPPLPAAVSAACPCCGRDLVKRKARKGANAGAVFWGCEGYPSCRYTRDI